MKSLRATSRLGSAVLPFVGTAILIGAWWAVVVIFNIRTFFLPSPPDIVNSFLETREYLIDETLVTLRETLIGYSIAAVVGLVIAIALTSSSVVERATMPVLVALNSIPKVAVAPLLIVWLGFGEEPRIILVTVMCFFPVVVSTMSGLTSTPSDLNELTRSFSAPWWRTYFKVRLPWALPQVFTGLKVAVSLAVIGAVVAEINSPNSGLGAVIVLSGANFDTPLAFAAIAILALMSIVLYYVVVALERLMLPWAKAISA